MALIWKKIEGRWAYFSLALPIIGLLAPLSVGIVFAQEVPFPNHSGIRDFIEYWAASRLLAQGGNPYSPEALLAVQHTAGWSGSAPLIMWNPPWSLVFTLPFGFFDFTVGQFFWLMFHVWLVLISAQCLWQIYGKSSQGSRLPWLLAFTFVPTVFVLIIGQITPLVLAGVTSFIYFEDKQKKLAMGVALVVLSIKPHLLYLFWIFLLLWVIEKQLLRLGLGAVLAGLIAALLPLLFNPKVYSEYVALYGISGILKPLDWPAPTLRNLLRLFLGVNDRWVQFAPTAIAIAWAFHHWRRYKHGWNWRDQVPIISVVSVASSIFVWTYDQVVLLPAILEGAAWIRQRPAPWIRFWCARVYVTINVIHLLMRFWLAEELWYFWLAPALLMNYFLFHWEKDKTPDSV